ncbi:glucose-methanol-choline oxidoreductase [Stachybotrys elegans]|uniref:Glucose-methanol-choline oxidoreductase n=1 Tax=Stachybotrys elegans TaxID=80388 RepID=A0A8K0WRA0_9HYPO|nr:glucose-methanol-choline oxidoreductase [Stachybotrys elegans]
MLRKMVSKSFLFAATLLSYGGISLAAPLKSCPSPKAGRGFDYVIIGGGTAGLVLANRLTEDRNIRVAVVEAGTFPEDVAGNWTQVPGYAGNFIVGAPEMSWGFHTTPQSGAEGHSYPYYRAKALGGCSTINYMAYAYTSRGAHELWADQVGDESYTFDNMLEYYHRTMNFVPPDPSARFANATPQYDEVDTTTGGGLDITYASYAQSWSTWLAEGLEAIGIPRTNHFIDGNLLGQSWQMNTITRVNGFRSSSQSAYLRPVLNRPNLAVFTNTLAEQILFDKKKRATGVRVTTNGRQCSISAKQEVILSAGVFQSPQLLMLSGVGPAPVLRKLKIPVIADRPGVGQNVEDHITVPISHQVNIVTNSAFSNPNVMAQAIEDFNNNARGLLASPGGDYMAMEKIPEDLRAEFSPETIEALSRLPDDWPEISFSVYPNGIPRDIGEPHIPGANYATLLATIIAPQSRGSISINSTRMADPPLIDLNIFTAQADQEILLAAFKRGRQALQSSAMAPVLIGDEVLPGLGVQSDEDIHEYIIHALNPLFHAFASNKMGRRSDPTAVVDTHGRVIGVKNLRVIDSSSFPFLPPGPAPQIQVYVLAEKLADDIKRSRA